MGRGRSRRGMAAVPGRYLFVGGLCVLLCVGVLVSSMASEPLQATHDEVPAKSAEDAMMGNSPDAPIEAPKRRALALPQAVLALDTPAERFVELLRRELHFSPGADMERLESCLNMRRDHWHCYVPKGTDNFMSVLPYSDMTVAQLLMYEGTNVRIPALGTFHVCLPLLLAAVAIGDSGVVVEMGPFAGFSTRCISAGLRAANSNAKLHAFDSFAGTNNENALKRTAESLRPGSGASLHEDFSWLFKMAVDDVYPHVEMHKGLMSRETVYPALWGNERVALLSIDSIKSWGSWKQQLAGFGPLLLEKGSILSLMDFTHSDQPNLVYTCLRDYLTPVYASFCANEHWIFTVDHDIPATLAKQCVKEKLRDGPPSFEITHSIRRQLHEDILQLLDPAGYGEPSYSKKQYDAMHCLEKELGNKVGRGVDAARFWRRFQE